MTTITDHRQHKQAVTHHGVSAEHVLGRFPLQELWQTGDQIVLQQQLHQRLGRALQLLGGLVADQQALLSGLAVDGQRGRDEGPDQTESVRTESTRRHNRD